MDDEALCAAVGNRKGRGAMVVEVADEAVPVRQRGNLDLGRMWKLPCADRFSFMYGYPGSEGRDRKRRREGGLVEWSIASGMRTLAVR